MTNSATTADVDEPAAGRANPSRRSPKSRPETVAKRMVILKQAVEVFGEKGYANASLAEIADRVGMTHAGILHHFGSKQNLLLEAVSHRDQSDLAEHGWRTIPRGRAQFDHLIETAFRNAERPGIVQAFVVLSADAVTSCNPALAYFQGRYRVLRKDIAENFEALCAQAGVTDTSAIAHATASILAVMDGLQYQWLLDPGAVDLGEATRFAINAIVDAVLGPPAARDDTEPSDRG